MFIAFSGLDCSGKSTQIEFLKKALIEKNKNIVVFWSRGGYTPGFQILKNLMRLIFGRILPKPGNSQKRDKAFSNPFIRRIWITFAILDLILFYSLYLRFKYFLNYNIIFDRYLIDTNIDFQLAYPTDKTDKWFLWRLLKYTAIRPNYHFISTIPISESIIRSKSKLDPFPDSPQTLEKRLQFYIEELRQNEKLIHIDGMNDINEIKKYIYLTVKQL